MVYLQHIPSSNLPIKRAERFLPSRVSARASAFPPRVRDTTTRPLASRALITALATLEPSGLPHGGSSWAEGCRGDRARLEACGKHRPGLRPAKALRCRGPVRACEAKGVERRQTCTLSRASQASQLMVPQGEVPVAPCDIGAGALAHLRQLFGLLVALALRPRAPLGHRATGLPQRRAPTSGQGPKRLARPPCAPLGHTLERE